MSYDSPRPTGYQVPSKVWAPREFWRLPREGLVDQGYPSCVKSWCPEEREVCWVHDIGRQVSQRVRRRHQETIHRSCEVEVVEEGI